MSARSRPLFTDAVHHRGTYHSPFSGDHRGRDRDRDRDHDRDRDRFRFFGFFGPTFPLWGWGYPYAYPFLPDYWDTWDDYDSQPNSNYAAAQSYPEYAPSPYGAPGPERYEQDAESYQPWPYSKPAASSPQPAATSQPSVAAAPVTVVFKDGRPSEQIYNYMLTPKTLSVLDQHRHDIPVDQIDLAATARVNHQAGIEFALPGGSR